MAFIAALWQQPLHIWRIPTLRALLSRWLLSIWGSSRPISRHCRKVKVSRLCRAGKRLVVHPHAKAWTLRLTSLEMSQPLGQESCFSECDNLQGVWPYTARQDLGGQESSFAATWWSTMTSQLVNLLATSGSAGLEAWLARSKFISSNRKAACGCWELQCGR